MNANFEKLLMRNGGVALLFLVHIQDKSKKYDMYFCNDNEDIEFENHIYKKSSFSYIPNVENYGFDGGGKLEIETKDNLLIDLVESSEKYELNVIQIIKDRKSISVLKRFFHQYGTLNGNKTTLSFTFEKDDRISMTFPTLIFGNDNNKGNN